MQTCVIINPNAGSVEGVVELRERLAVLPETSVQLTEDTGDACELARQAVADGAGLVVAAGGDGTLNEVLNGMAEGFGRVRLGLLPLGTGNDFARSIDVPADLEGALAVLAAGRTRWVDVGRATIGARSRHFLNMAVGGISPIVSEKAGEAKERWGPLAYFRGAIDALPELQGFKAVLHLNHAERLELDLYNLVIANGRYVAAGIPVAPQAELDDGLLDVMIAPAITIPQLALIVPQVLLGRHLENELLIFRKATCLEVESTPPMPFNVDGEIIGEEPARFEVLPRALEVLVGGED